ncbi:hypothetical protein H8F24_06470 [Synechococcus sp. CBW1002]|uniref:hypothetical protein n=1 Tax=Synechococcus sp. CBW1002 TaxID=1353134 RepID=UPI0018CF1F8D|nr:hypothetical protein [Synechococcus sp. CBW1002]QPN60966.1 hypothetical protein H8F24_06470 [Synechococcus sp. CBW1002]
MARPCGVRVAIPHYFDDRGSEQGYGSRNGKRLSRSLALARCLGSVLGLARSERESVLDIAGRGLRTTAEPVYPTQRLAGIAIECHVFVTGDAWLEEVLTCFSDRLHVHRLDLEDPRDLPAAARQHLLERDPVADLSLYLEDDLVIQDPDYLDKLLWCAQLTEQRVVLMPHRYELRSRLGLGRLFVDGPLDWSTLVAANPMLARHRPQANVAEACWRNGEMLHFDRASNPHAGSFALSRPQLQQLRQQADLPRDGFVGPLETVATYTVLQHFEVWKPAWNCRQFLTIEHGYPSFLGYTNHLPNLGTIG